jgi:hypothetical protein
MGLKVLDLWGQRGAGVEVVGESQYMADIRHVVGQAHDPDGTDHDFDALLVPEPQNSHDPNAVAVQIEGRTVGYLGREDAARYSSVLLRLAEQGYVAQVGSRIWARDYNDVDIDRRGRLVESVRFGAGITLRLAEPHLIVPSNMPPGEPYEMLPAGPAIQVTGEEAHLGALAAYIGPAGEQWAYATLHELIEQLPRSTRTVIEVRLDGQRVGQLSPKMSSDLLPAIRHLTTLSVTTACRALVKGNRAAAQVVLYVQRSHELDDAWFDRVARRAPGRRL